ncbi:MAG TPA: TIGR03085 family metal-binding protein [Trebonia sp.]|nr:TIGR03085 family metal-binding protein [Trebonia sp.]
MSYSREERLALAALLEETGPDAPTLCAGWQTRDLAAHLVLRESRPDAAAGVAGGPLAGYTAMIQRRLSARLSYAELIQAFRNGPPRLSPFALPRLDEAGNTVEYFVHHEDVRRASPGWAPRELPGGLTDYLWNHLKRARIMLRRSPVGIEVARDGGTDGDGRYRLTLKNATPAVTVTGSPAELTMWALGRTSAASVRLDGPENAVARLRAWRQGLAPGTGASGPSRA